MRAERVCKRKQLSVADCVNFPITEDGKAVKRREWDIKEDRGGTGKMREEVEEERGTLLLARQFP